jgi:hypothetical protein
VGPRTVDLGRSRGGLTGDQPWRVPQRRQKRAVADSDRPQLEHGWTPDVGAGALIGVARTSCADAAQRPSLDERPARFVKSAIEGDSIASGRTGHCGAADAAGGCGATGGWTGVTGDVGATAGGVAAGVASGA